MFGNSLRIGRVLGIEISIDASWLVIAFLVGWSFFLQFDRVMEPTGQALTLAVASTVVFFLSVLLHEISHSVVARSLGIPVGGITLFLFGGVTRTRLDSERPGHEFRVAIVGPLTSLLIALVLWGVTLLPGLPEGIAFATGYLAWLNLALAVFNLLPGFPLDGGRVLRAAVWAASGSLAKATRVASTGGRVVGGGLIAFGLLQVFAGNLGGLWLAAIGWFLYQAAVVSGQDVAMRRLLQGVTARELMSGPPVTIDRSTSLSDAVDDYFFRHDHSSFPVVQDGAPIGLLTLRQVKAVPRDLWGSTTVAAAMTPLEELCVVPPGKGMDEVLDALQGEDPGRVLVAEDGDLQGIISPRDVARWVRLVQELELEPERVASRHGG